MDNLAEAGFFGVTRKSILGRGQQRGLKVRDMYYGELPETMFMIVLDDNRKAEAMKVISATCRTGKNGAYGDGKIFIIPVEKVITISDGSVES
jgi:nitrogen regulatory protein PII 1